MAEDYKYTVSIPRKRPINQKPPLGAEINWGHPLSKSIVGCWLMNEGGGYTARNSALYNYPATFTTDFSGTPTSTFPYFVGEGVKLHNGWNKISFGKLGFVDYSSTVLFSYSLLIKLTSFDNLMRLFKKADDGSYAYFDVSSSSGKIKIDMRSNTTSLQVIGNTVLPLNKTILLTIVVGSYTDATKVRIFINNVEDTYATQTNGVGTNIGSYQWQFGSGSKCPIGILKAVYFWKNRALSPSEIQQLYIDPYCFIKQDYKLYYVAPAATTFTFSPIINIF